MGRCWSREIHFSGGIFKNSHGFVTLDDGVGRETHKEFDFFLPVVS